ncbi:MAG: hypothetical protein ABSG63_13695, partial [Spirochaetia bacterium]
MKKSYIKKRIAWPRIRPAATFAIILLFSACNGSFMSQVTQDVATKYPDLHVLLKATNAEVPSSGYSYNYHQIALNDVSTVDFLITNKGEAALTLQVPTVQVTPVGAFSTSQPADTVLAPGVATQFSVTFSPPAQQGYSASITVLSDDPHHPAFTFSVQGSGSIPPDGLFYIANNASYTNSTTVALTMIFTTPPAWMRFGNTSDLSGAMWEPYAASRANWQLSAGADGQRTVYAQFKDSAGIPSVLKQDSIVLDTVAPSGSITSINGGALYCSSRSVSLLLNATDSGSGVKSMRFMDSASAIPPTFPDPSVLPWQNYATSYSYSLTSASDGTKYVFAQYLDNAGNATTSAISNSITLDTAAPVVNSFSVSSTLTNTRSITLSANVTDSPSGMKDMRFTDSTSSTPPADWSAIPWQTYNTSYSYALASSGDGLKYIHAQFRDTAGNIATALSSTTLDT